MSISQIEQDSVPHQASVAVVLETEDERLVAEATRIQTLLSNRDQKASCLLYFGQNGVEIRPIDRPHQSGYQVDFSTIDRRTGTGNLSRRQPLPKSIGSNTTTIVDATAGFGKDAGLLALMGYHVIAIERSPIIATMLRDGLWRASQDAALWRALGGRLQIIEADSKLWLTKNCSADTVYIDPMFPLKKKKSALPPGHIQQLQLLVGCDHPEETNQLFQVAMHTALRRVVVKRPNYAPHFKDHPTAIHQGKLVRYEVYHPISLVRADK